MRKVCLGMPSYGQITSGAARGFYRASAGGLKVAGMQQESSLLACNMNALWCWALNEARKGECDYFAMIHADIEPEEFWLDKLVAELEARDLDVLGAVAPIKDQRGVTSIAMARPDGNNWRCHARLTMKEIFRLPETFTSEDVGFPLLINTGLWVCRFKEEWAKKVHFTVNDRICYDPKKEVYFAQTEPEDWFISRLFHELGLKVGATRKVVLGHRGAMPFGNTTTWGTQDFDKEYLQESVIPNPLVWFPHDAAGWLTEREGKALAELAADKVVLEIGSYCGRSTICLAQKARSVSAVDTFDGRGTNMPGETLGTFKDNVSRYGVDNKVNILQGRSDEVVPKLPPIFDLIFIDGSHDYESASADAEIAMSALRPGGLLAFHDYRKYPGEVDGRWDSGVTKTVEELLENGGELIARHDSLAVVRPPAGNLCSV